MNKNNLHIVADAELSFLEVKAQSDRELCTVTEKQAAEIHKLYEQECFSETVLSQILREKEENEKFSIGTKNFAYVFRRNILPNNEERYFWKYKIRGLLTTIY